MFRIVFLRGLHSRVLQFNRTFSGARGLPNPGGHSTFIYRMNDKGLAVALLSQALLKIYSNRTARTSMRRSYGTPREYNPHDIIQHPPHSQTLSQILIIMYSVKRLLIFISSCYHFAVFRTLTQGMDSLKHHPTAIVLIHHIYFWSLTLVVLQHPNIYHTMYKYISVQVFSIYKCVSTRVT